MTKRKEQKKKDRERRVAQKKLAETERRRAEAKASGDEQGAKSRPKKIMTAAALPKTQQMPAAKKTPFTHRRTGG